jgi:hypothetical protein
MEIRSRKSYNPLGSYQMKPASGGIVLIIKKYSSKQLIHPQVLSQHSPFCLASTVLHHLNPHRKLNQN